MKKNLFMAMIAVIVTAACAKVANEPAVKENQNEETPVATGPRTIKLGASVNSATKTSFTDAGVGSWLEGDSISVCVKKDDSYKLVIFTNTADDPSIFSGVVDAGWELTGTAMYPANDEHVVSSTGEVSFMLPKVYDLTAHDSSNIPMLGTQTSYDEDSDTYYFNFKAVCGALKLNLENVPYETNTMLIASGVYTHGLYGLDDDNYLKHSTVYDYFGVSNDPGSFTSDTYTYFVFNRDSDKKATIYVPLTSASRSYVGIFFYKGEQTSASHNSGYVYGGNKLASGTALKVPNTTIRTVTTLDFSKAITASITIDGDFEDWIAYDAQVESTNDNQDLREIRVAHDDDNIYFYMKIRKADLNWVNGDGGTAARIRVNIDGDTSTGDDEGYDHYTHFKLFNGSNKIHTSQWCWMADYVSTAEDHWSNTAAGTQRSAVKSNGAIEDEYVYIEQKYPKTTYTAGGNYTLGTSIDVSIYLTSKNGANGTEGAYVDEGDPLVIKGISIE